MRVDTYFLTSSAPRVVAARRASSMSSVATSFVVKDNKSPETSSVLTSSTTATFGLHKKNMPNHSSCSTNNLTSASYFDVLDKQLSLRVVERFVFISMPSKYCVASEIIALSPHVMQKRSRARSVLVIPIMLLDNVHNLLTHSVAWSKGT